MNPWPDWLKVIQLKPRFLFGIWLIGALILFLPQKAAEGFGFLNIREHYRGWIGIGTISAFAFWCIQLIPLFSNYRSTTKYKTGVTQSLSSLSQEEWFLVAYCLNRNQQTITLELTHRAARALVAKGIFIAADGVGNSLSWPYTIPNFLWNHIKANGHLIFNKLSPADDQLQNAFAQLERTIRRHDGWR